MEKILYSSSVNSVVASLSGSAGETLTFVILVTKSNVVETM